MKTTCLIAFLVAAFSLGCSPKEPAPNENVHALYDRFHGKYEPTESTSNEAIDVNLDGKVSTDMLTELPQLNRQYGNILGLRIYGRSANGSERSFLFTQWWPEQYIRLYGGNRDWTGEPLDYNPTTSVNYAMQGTVRYFSFSPDLRQIDVQPDKDENPFRWLRPESVTVNADSTIQVVNKRLLYTSMGVKDVVITTVYKRYTMVT